MKKLMTHPINLLYKHLITKSSLKIILVTNDIIINGKIIGFDEYMNIVLDASIVTEIKSGNIKSSGIVLIKSHNICEIYKIN